MSICENLNNTLQIYDLKKNNTMKKIYVNWKELEYICTYLPINTANAMLFSIISSKLSTNIFLALHISGACKRKERKLKTLGENLTIIKVTPYLWNYGFKVKKT